MIKIESKSRNVRGYVKATLRYRALAAKYQAKLDALAPLKRKVDEASKNAIARSWKLTGGQKAEALRLLNSLLPISDTPALVVSK